MLSKKVEKFKKIFDVLFDLDRSINKLVFVKNLNLCIPTTYKHIKRLIERLALLFI